MSGSFRKAKGQRPAACSAPRGASRGCSAGDEAGQGDAGRLGWPGAPRPGPALTRKAGQRRPCPHRHTRPCHVLLHASWRPAFGGWHARHPDWRPGWGRTEESLVRQRAAAAGGVRRPEGWTLTWPPVRAEAPIAAPSRPALARLGHGLRSPVPRLTAASSQLPTPVCARLPPPTSSHSLCPARLASSGSRLCPWLPWMLYCLSRQPRGPRGAGEVSPGTPRPPRTAAGPQCHVGAAHPQAGPEQPPCCRNP